MKVRKTAAALAVLALSAGLTAGAWAQDLTDTDDSDDTPVGINDTTGLSALGVDISDAGTSPDQIQQFIATLAPDTQRGVLGGCQTVTAYPAGVAPNVVLFCQNALGAPVAPMGYMPEPTTVAPDLNPAY